MEINIRKKSGKTPNGVLALSEKSIEEAAKALVPSQRFVYHLPICFTPVTYPSGNISSTVRRASSDESA